MSGATAANATVGAIEDIAWAAVAAPGIFDRGFVVLTGTTAVGNVAAGAAAVATAVAATSCHSCCKR